MYQQFLNPLGRFCIFVVFVVVALPAYAAININTADKETLMTLTGIGEVKAQAIIDYRTGPQGPFETIEEIMQVSGIGEATFNNIKSFITVSEDSTPTETTLTETSFTQEATPPPTGGGVWIEDTKSISVSGGEDRVVFVGADSVFEAKVIGAVGDPIQTARVIWSFGNGDRAEGKKILYNFPFPGEYIVVVDAANDVYSATDRIRVKAIPALVTISEVTSEYIALKNSTSVEVDIGGWILFSLGKQFQFPENTVIASGQEVLVSNKRTGLSGADPGSVALQYPNGLVATSYEYPLFLNSTNKPVASSGVVSYTASKNTNLREVPGVPQSAVEGNLITSPVAALEGEGGVWPWVLGVVTMAVLGGSVGVYFKRRKTYYEFEEIS